MTTQSTLDRYDFVASPRLIDLDGVRTRRILAFFFDAFVILTLNAAGAVVLFVLGLMTFGLLFPLYAILFPAVALTYSGATLGGPRQATLGMQLAGIRIFRRDGRPSDFLYGALHTVLFYLSMALLTPFVLLFSWLNPEKRLLHDILLGGIVLRDL